MTVLHTVRVVVVAALMVLTATGCSQVVTGSAQRSSVGKAPGPAACTRVDAPLQGAATRGSGEPVLRVPQPENWKPVSKMNRRAVRYLMANPALTGNMFTPNVVVTLERAPVWDARSIFAEAERTLRKQSTVSNMTAKPGRLCGLPAETMTFNGDRALTRGQRSVTALVVVASVGSRQYVVTVTAQTAEPANATYQKDLKTIMDGLQVLAPTT